MWIFPHSYVPRLTARLADLLEIRSRGRLREPLAAYEKARINRLLNEVKVGRMAPDDAQRTLAAAWIAEYGPRRYPLWRRLLTPVKQ
jgi:hypothetical protein